MNGPELQTIIIAVDEARMAAKHGVRGEGEQQEHIVTVPGTDICVTASSKNDALETAVNELRAVLAARRIESEQLAAEVDGRPAKVVLDGTTGAPKAANTTKNDREEEERRLLDVPLEELARTMATLDEEAKPYEQAKSSAENALNKITKRRKMVIAEFGRRGHKIIERDLGKHEFDMR